MMNNLYADKSVLIIEDAKLQTMMLTRMLEKMGVGTIYTAKDGLEGVRAARYYKPNLILLDLQMPNIDGFQTCQKIRLFADKIMMPILVITGRDKSDALGRVFDLGANDYFQKPFNTSQVRSRIKFYLEYCDVLRKLNRLETYITQDLETSRLIQKRALPELKTTKKHLAGCGLDFHAYVGEGRLGGDSWCVHYLKSGEAVFSLFDITGHGINAAINNSFVTSFANAIFSNYAHLSAKEFNLLDYFHKLNIVVSRHIQTGTFCTSVCFTYDCSSGRIRYVGCGMPPIKLVNCVSGEIENFSCAGLPIGVSEVNFNPSSGELCLKDNHILLVMTDGLTESMTGRHLANIHRYKDILPGERLLDVCLRNLQKARLHSNDDSDLVAEEDMRQDAAALSCEYCLGQIVQEFINNDYDLLHDDVTLLGMKKKYASTQPD